MECYYSREVYYYETDRMGIVHNSNYLRLFEEGRLEHMRQLGLSYPELEAQGIMIPQIEAHVTYHKPLRYGDRFRIHVKLTEFNGLRIGYNYEITNIANGEKNAEGMTRHCFIDETSRIPISIKKKQKVLYEKMLQVVETVSV